MAEEKQPFNQTDYLKEWTRKNMSTVIAKYKKDFVLEFKEACKALGVTQSEVIRKAMEETISKAQEKQDD